MTGYSECRTDTVSVNANRGKDLIVGADHHHYTAASGIHTVDKVDQNTVFFSYKKIKAGRAPIRLFHLFDSGGDEENRTPASSC